MTSPGSAGQSQTLERVLKIQLPVIAVIGETRMKLGDVLRLNVGSVIETARAGDQPLDLLVNDQRIGAGKPIRSGENYGLQIIEIGQPKDTIIKLGERHNP